MIRKIIFTPIFLSFLLCCQTANAERVLDVMTYAKNNDLRDRYVQANLMQRCAGVYMGYAKYLPTGMQKQKLALAKIAQNIAVEAGMKLYEKNQNTQKANLEQNMNAFLFYTNHYYSMIEKTQLATGSIFSGQALQEFNFCKELFVKKQWTGTPRN